MKRSINNSSFAVKLIPGVLILAVILVFGSIQNVFAIPPELIKEKYTIGEISSIQNDENGNPAWLVNGFWKSTLLNQSQTPLQNKNIDQGNLLSSSYERNSTFTTSFEMIRLNGTAEHYHTLTNFKLNDDTMSSQNSNGTMEFNGTATLSIKDVIITDVPTTIKVFNNKVISVFPDPEKIDNHYGNTPIYGVVKENKKGDYSTGR